MNIKSVQKHVCILSASRGFCKGIQICMRSLYKRFLFWSYVLQGFNLETWAVIAEDQHPIWKLRSRRRHIIVMSARLNWTQKTLWSATWRALDIWRRLLLKPREDTQLFSRLRILLPPGKRCASDCSKR